MAIVKSFAGDGLSNGAITTGTAGAGDTHFDALTGTGLAVVTEGIRPPCIGVPDGTGLLYATWTVTTLSNWAARFYIKTATAPNNGTFFSTYDASTNKVTAIDFNSSGQLRLSTNPGTNVNFNVANVAFPLGQWVRVEYTEFASGAWTLAYYPSDATVATYSASGTKATAQTVTAVRVGRLTGANASSGLYYDDIAVADAATPIGPVPSGAPATPWSAITSEGLVPLYLTAL